MKLPEFGLPLPAKDKQLILGQPSQQLFPLKYEWMWDAYQDAQANHWTPLDIQMGQDRLDYLHKLTEEERWMYDWALSMLTTQDLVVMGNLEEGIERHLTCPEASMYLARQTDEESIHTWAYQLVIESLALDQDSVYQRFLHERSLYDKVVYAYEFHRKLLELRMDDHHSLRAIGKFMVCLAFWALVMEGGWFYQGFNWIYALRRRGLLPGTTEMFQYIQRDEAGHFGFWIKVINTLIAEYPEAYTSGVQRQIAEMVVKGAHLEQRYAEDVCNSVLGITSTDYMAHYRHFANVNLSKLGIKPAFSENEAYPMDWVAEYQLNQEVNFFEGRVREYRKSGLGAWEGDEGDDHFASVMPSPTNEETPDD